MRVPLTVKSRTVSLSLLRVCKSHDNHCAVCHAKHDPYQRPMPPRKRNRFMCYNSVAESVHSSRAIASKALAGRYCTNHNYIQQLVVQSSPASMTTLGKLGLSLTGMIRISTVICYASCDP